MEKKESHSKKQKSKGNLDETLKNIPFTKEMLLRSIAGVELCEEEILTKKDDIGEIQDLDRLVNILISKCAQLQYLIETKLRVLKGGVRNG